jgi:uncharacterized protein YkwD
MRRLGYLVTLFLFLAIAAGDASACSRRVSEAAAGTLVSATYIDYRLLDKAIRAEVNYHRCRAGLGEVSYAGDSLMRVALKHSTWMAKKDKLSHFSTLQGLKSLGERVRAASISYRSASENIVAVHQYQIDNRRFKTLDRKACQFAADGKLIPPHSYASLARHSVNLWMKSPGHRKNILSPKSAKMVVAVAHSNTRRYCGKFWLTQNFIG